MTHSQRRVQRLMLMQRVGRRGLIGTSLLALVLAASCVVQIAWWPSPNLTLRLHAGTLSVFAFHPTTSPHATRMPVALIQPEWPAWRIDGHFYDWGNWLVRLPHWVCWGTPLVCSLALLMIPRRAARAVAAGACRSCGYERAGLAPHAPCPECGHAG